MSEGGAVGTLSFPEEKAGDHEAGDDEEDVDADITSAEDGNTGVIEDDEKYGDRAETFDVRTKRAVARSGPRLVS